MLQRPGLNGAPNRRDVCVFCSVLLSASPLPSRTRISSKPSRYLTTSSFASNSVAAASRSQDQPDLKSELAPRTRRYGGLFQSSSVTPPTPRTSADKKPEEIPESNPYFPNSRCGRASSIKSSSHLSAGGQSEVEPGLSNLPGRTVSEVPLRYTSKGAPGNQPTRQRRDRYAARQERYADFPAPDDPHSLRRVYERRSISKAFRSLNTSGSSDALPSEPVPRKELSDSKRPIGWGSLPTRSTHREGSLSNLENEANENHLNGLVPSIHRTAGRFVPLDAGAASACFICKAEDHSAANCPQQLFPRRMVSIHRLTQGPASKSTPPKPPVPARCYICNEEGHTASTCPRQISSFSPVQPVQGQQDENAHQPRPIGAFGAWPVSAPDLPVTTSNPLPAQQDARQRGRSGRWPRRAAEEGDDSANKSKEAPSRRLDRYGDDGVSEEYYHDHFDDEFMGNERRKRGKRQNKQPQNIITTPTPILLPDFISVANLATALGTRVESFLVKMEELGFVEAAHDQILGSEDAGLIAQEYGFEPLAASAKSKEDIYAAPAVEDPAQFPQRPPVVTIMGHVDHGKTTILDYMRKSSIAATEHGGITQRIGAFVVPLSSGKMITMLDTPGHAAFLSMRRRGAIVTDIVVLVVAADDSVMPQTVEAIKHAKSAGVPVIVAINKCDREEANPDRVKKDLSLHGIDVEDFGGDTQSVCVSAKTGSGMQALEEAIVTLGEIQDHRAPTDGQVEGWVLESTTKDRGKVATVLVRRGTLRASTILVAGTAWARVRSLRSEAGLTVAEAGPGIPVEVDGWKELPKAGDEVLQTSTESKATSAVEHRQTLIERMKMAEDMGAINLSRRLEPGRRELELQLGTKKAHEDGPTEETAEDATSPSVIEVQFMVKADVAGSSEAVVHAISNIGNNEIRAKILRSGVGAVTASDVDYASTTGTTILSFNSPLSPQVLTRAERVGVKILHNSIIYRIVEDVTDLLGSKLPPIKSKRVSGEADIAQIFEIRLSSSKRMKIAGCRVRNGVINRSAKIRVLRDAKVVYEGTLTSLKNVKKDVTEMRKDTECGIGFENWEAFEVGDQVQAYQTVEERRYL